MEKVLCGPGVITSETLFDFDFKDVTMTDESYNGLNVRLRFVHSNYIAFSCIRLDQIGKIIL
jgi:hypothetical protein